MIYLIVASLYGESADGIYTGLVEAADQSVADQAAAQELDRLYGKRFTIRRSVILAPRNADQSFGDTKPIVHHGAMLFTDKEQ